MYLLFSVKESVNAKVGTSNLLTSEMARIQESYLVGMKML